jgi:hypothetical protein
LLEEHKEVLRELFMNGEKNKGEKMSAALMMQHLRSIAESKGWSAHHLPGLSEVAPYVSQMAQKRKKGNELTTTAGHVGARKTMVVEEHETIIKAGYAAYHAKTPAPSRAWSDVNALAYLTQALREKGPLPVLPKKAAVGRLLAALSED